MKMHPQLAAIVSELDAAQERLHRLAARLPDDLWPRRPAPERWSVGECVAHLNLTSRAYLPVLHSAIDEARALGGPAPARYHRDPLGWMLWATMGPPARFRVRTTAAFVPSADDAPAEIRAGFDALQAELAACVRAGDGLPLQKVKIASPFEPRARYNLFAALGILARHQHRHLWQAEEAADALAAGVAPAIPA
jgi:hypothetical protein